MVCRLVAARQWLEELRPSSVEVPVRPAGASLAPASGPSMSVSAPYQWMTFPDSSTERLDANHKPAVFAVEAAQTRYNFCLFSRRQDLEQPLIHRPLLTRHRRGVYNSSRSKMTTSLQRQSFNVALGMDLRLLPLGWRGEGLPRERCAG